MDKRNGDSVHEEMHVATVLLGFLFVAISLLVSMPDDVLAILVRTGIEGYFNTFISYANFITWIILALLISFVVSVVLYLVYLNKGSGLKVARTFFALGLFGSVYLYLFICLLFTVRFFGKEGAVLLNYGLTLGDFLLIPLILGYLVYLWRNVFKRFRILRALKRIRLNQRNKEPQTSQ